MKQQKKLLLHFDLNKTIVLADSQYPNQIKKECLQEILVAYAQGKLEQRDEKSPILCKTCRRKDIIQRIHLSIISIKNLKVILKILKKIKLVQYINLFIGIQRTTQIIIFLICKIGLTVHEIEARIRQDYQIYCKIFYVNLGQMNEEDVEQRNLNQLLNDKYMLNNLFSDNKYQLLSTFYNTIINLKKQKREFAIIFRPFGQDPKNILRQFNNLGVEITLLLLNLMVLRELKVILYKKKQCALLYRQQKELVTGSLRRTDKQQLEDGYEKNQKKNQFKLIILNKCYQRFQNLQKKVAHFIIIKSNESNAKQQYIDSQDADTLHIFFDFIDQSIGKINSFQIKNQINNLQENDNNLVQVIGYVTLEPINRKKCLSKYLVHIDIWDVIKDPDYFIKQINICEKNRNEEIERREKGIPEEQAELPKKTDWELLEESSDVDFQRQTILPLLLPVLQLLDIEMTLILVQAMSLITQIKMLIVY
ncbi:unnamed protein product [Paramecium sonneborni]|uniref:Uncharacterized protein n=1 Tax=Paramecium sonneborni TaxID=65129 RepID=A0A8S1Q335_9CILI|nr:unnamed protein product [Paramecium sonneborni]